MTKRALGVGATCCDDLDNCDLCLDAAVAELDAVAPPELLDLDDDEDEEDDE
jgi:hypothetical protein